MNKAIFLLVLIGLFLAGCTARPPTRAEPLTPASTRVPADAPQSIEGKSTVAPTLESVNVSLPDFATLPDNLARGELPPDFTVTTLTGESFTLSDYRGSWVLLTFMANGCPSCVYEITSLAEVYPAYAGQGLVTLVVDIQPFDTPASLQRYIDSFPYPMVNWTIDSEARVAPLYNILELGTTLLINPNGNIVYRDRQATGPEEFQQLLELAVSAAP